MGGRWPFFHINLWIDFLLDLEGFVFTFGALWVFLSISDAFWAPDWLAPG